MKDTKISDSVIYIGADDKTLDLFESQYVIPNGVSYNSYLILDEKVTVMDTVDARATDEWLQNLDTALDGKKCRLPCCFPHGTGPCSQRCNSD